MAVPRRADAIEPVRIGGRYVVEAKIGGGGMGTVYRVRDEHTGRRVALKCMTWRHEGDDTAAELRFRREFHSMASLRHPRIVEVFDYGIDQGVPYYTMELLDGRDLYDLGKVPWRRACLLLRDVASALAFLHARRLLHRDLAPRNVRCTDDDHAKLIDFGVLATTGIAEDIAGTPPFMAPEALRGRPLDHRYDLYGLGALAYRILTGQHACAAREIEELEAAWRRPAVAPSALEPGIPPALDELVLSLLAHDPLARPAGASEVIDRLTVIGELERAAQDVETEHGWIASAQLVGRHREVAQLRRAISLVGDRNGRSIVIEAPSGTGKSRLLRGLALEAQLAGMTTVRAGSDAAGRGPYGILSELARGLLATAPAEAESAARRQDGRAETIARVIAPLRERLRVQPARPEGDPIEDRMRLQQALAAWVLDIAAERPVALLVDDVQRCDEASAAVLAALAHQAGDRKLLVASALRTDETVRAPAAIASLIDAGQRLRLRGLDEAEVGELCRSLFGDVPHIPQLAHWMHEAAGGSPLHTTEIARSLVDSGVIRYIDGVWSIPAQRGDQELPRGLAEAMEARVRALPAGARVLGEVLSVHGGELPLELIVELADSRDAEPVFAALDQLAYDEIMIQAGDSWRFRHDGLREAMLRGVPEARRQALHRRVGETLAALEQRRPDASGSAERDAEIGWHLMRGGDRELGAERLDRAGRALYEAQSFADAIPPLEAALEVHEQRRGSARVRLELLLMLMMAGCMSDRATALRHLEPCLQGYRYWAGIDVATRARRFIGGHLGVLVGLCWAGLRWLFSPRRGPSPYHAFHTFFVVIGYASSVYTISYDLVRSKALIDMVKPVAILEKRIPYAAFLLARNIYCLGHGDFAMCVRDCQRVLAILDHDRLTPLRDIDRRMARGAVHLLLAAVGTINGEPWLMEQFDALARTGLKYFDIGAQQQRAILHRIRGEEEAALAIEANLEVLFVQLGAVWQMQAFIPAQSTHWYGLARDMLGLRRMIDELAALCAEGMGYDGFAALARGEYLRERGDPAAALRELESIRCDDHPLMQSGVLPALAETLLALGELARARDVAQRGVTIMSAPETRNMHALLRCTRTLALAESAVGDHARAARRLDEAIAEAARFDSPLLGGSLHEARARIALAADDTVEYRRHLAVTRLCFDRTRNPVLVARASRLEAAGSQQASRAPTEIDEPPTVPSAARRSILAADAVVTGAPTQGSISAALSQCRGSAERATRALQLMIDEVRGASGYLFLRHGDELELAAPAWGDEPPASIVRALTQTIEDADLPRTVPNARPRREPDPAQWKLISLAIPRAGRPPVVIGAVAVRAGTFSFADPHPGLVEALARGLYQAGDVTTS